MVAVDLKSLIGRLNDPCRRSLEAAAGLTLSRSNFNVEIEHWLIKLLEAPDTDLLAILRQYEIEPSRLVTEMTRVLDRLKTGKVPLFMTSALTGENVAGAFHDAAIDIIKLES